LPKYGIGSAGLLQFAGVHLAPVDRLEISHEQIKVVVCHRWGCAGPATADKFQGFAVFTIRQRDLALRAFQKNLLRPGEHDSAFD
jgi:hypothetical protein